MNSQITQILTALRNGPITPLEALKRYGIMRLAARVYDLRHMGYTIATERRVVGSGDDRKTVAAYHLMKGPK